MSTLTNIDVLAAEYDMQPYEVAAALDLGTAREVASDFAHEVLDPMVNQSRDAL